MKQTFLTLLNWVYLLGSTILVCAFLGAILWELVHKGYSHLTWGFLSLPPTHGMTQGGILPALVGTVMLTYLTLLVAIPFGVSCAIYLNEYARPTLLTQFTRACIRNLSGIPSIIYGLFGLALFVQALQFGTSLLAAGCTLGLLTLPYIITTAEESLRRVPNHLREAAMALGATQFETIRDVVLPQAMSGILTGVILALSRAAGETAPILFTGAVFYLNDVRFALDREFMALPYHLYMLCTQHHAIEQVRPLAYSTALVLVCLVFGLNLFAFYLRYRQTKP